MLSCDVTIKPTLEESVNNFQRMGAKSNTEVGRAFEDRATKFLLQQQGVALERDYKLPCGLGNVTTNHKFDLGSDSLRIIVECKSHTWTKSGNVPGAKIKNWVEAMFYFYMAPEDYRKIFFIEQSKRNGDGESLGCYFIRTQKHLIPDDVEFWELGENDELFILD